MFYGFPKSRSKAEKLADAEKAQKKLATKGVKTSPVRIEGMKIAKSFWGKAWCDNLESYRDYEYRLDRGRSYVRSGCVIDLRLDAGAIRALVQGSSLYKITITVAPLPATEWQALRDACFGKIDSLVALLAGQLSDGVMRLVTKRPGGLFPEPKQIKLDCSCPDGASMCKHVAAAMYGIGHRLDAEPGLLFTLRGLDPAQLIREAAAASATTADSSAASLDADNLGALFGIDLDDVDSVPAAKSVAPANPVALPSKPALVVRKKPAAKRATPGKVATKTKPKAAPVKSRATSAGKAAIKAKPGKSVAKAKSAAKPVAASKSPVASRKTGATKITAARALTRKA